MIYGHHCWMAIGCSVGHLIIITRQFQLMSAMYAGPGAMYASPNAMYAGPNAMYAGPSAMYAGHNMPAAGIG